MEKKRLVKGYKDLEAHTKCCKVCAFRKDQSEIPGKSRFDLNSKVSQQRVLEHPFFCTHRDESNGKIKLYVCAGWHAMTRGKLARN